MAKLRHKLLDLIGEKERELGRRLTQAEIAEAAGVQEATLSRWLKTSFVKRPDADTVTNLCLYFGVDVGDLLYIDHNAN